jgi:hypothetical protein
MPATKELPATDLPADLAPRRKVSVREAAALNDLSEDSFRRHYSHLIKSITPRRQVVALADALAIGKTPTAA